MRLSALSSGLFCALLIAPTAQAFPYVDLIDYPRQEANWDRFFALEGRLQQGFDRICGDTFCEGEYSDIRALRLRCSVDAVHGTVHECLWAFAASDLAVSRHGRYDRGPAAELAVPAAAGAWHSGGGLPCGAGGSQSAARSLARHLGERL